MRSPAASLRRSAILLAALGCPGCLGDDLAPTIWPPADFACEVAETALSDGVLQVVRQVRVDASGTVVYGTASAARVDPTSSAALPVFDRLAIYKLVPECVRAFVRRIDRLGVHDLDAVQGERGVASDGSLVLRWRAFGRRKSIVARGRLHGPMAEILDVVTAHLPAGERFGLPGLAERQVVPVLRGVPEPVRDAGRAFLAHQELVAGRDGERGLLLDTFALACATGARGPAEDLLRRWLAAGDARPQNAFADEGSDAFDQAALRRLLPPQ
ncbi:MAG: hypothetical protein WAT39_23090 [Planctomycetota bacterium]